MGSPAHGFGHLEEDIVRLAEAKHSDPFSVLGLHTEPHNRGLSVRIFHPGATAVEAVLGGQRIALTALGRGFFAGIVAPDGLHVLAYRLRITTPNGLLECDDPYRFGLIISPEDAIDLKAGRCWRAHKVLGAHAAELEGLSGIRFAVWAPTAKRVSVLGDWNGWEPARRPMRFRHEIGVWEFFEPGLPADAPYAFDILTTEGRRRLKRDPYARALSAAAPAAAVAAPASLEAWSDEAWLAKRRSHADESVFTALHCVTSADHDPRPGGEKALLDRIQNLGGTHLCLMQAWTPPPNAERNTEPGSRLAPAMAWGGQPGLRRLIDGAHARGLGIVIDWPIHAFSNEAEGLARFDGSAMYEHANRARALSPDGSVRRFNYARYETANFLICAALFWLEDMHVDGLYLRGVRHALQFHAPPGQAAVVDAAGVDFLRSLNELVALRAPGAFVLSDAHGAWPGISAPTWAGGLGCARSTAPHWAGWLGDPAQRMLAMLTLPERAGALAFEDWLAGHTSAPCRQEAGLAALMMATLPGWKIWPGDLASPDDPQNGLHEVIGALNRAQPQGALSLLAHPGAQQDLLAFTRGENLLCAANLSRTQARASCPAPGPGPYRVLARSQRDHEAADRPIQATAAPESATGWALPVDLAPRCALAAQIMGAQP